VAAWWDYLSITLGVLPGAYAWWSGRRLLRFIDDPALNERALARAGQVTQVATVALTVLFFLGGRISNWMIPVVILGVVVGGFRARRRLFEERWSFSQYFAFNLRFWIAWAGFWLLLAMSPYIVYSAGNSNTIIGALLAALLLVWYFRYYSFFAAILGVRPRELLDFHRTIVERSRVKEVALFRIPVPGGRMANAWAIPTKPKAGVVFTDTLLESLTPEEEAAILAHELAHLERIAEGGRQRWIERSIILLLILIGSFGPLLPGVALWMVLGWSVFILLLVAALASHAKKIEEASDRRAVELCGDPAALERGLIKLTTLARLPHRWSLQMEASSTHPSLANRIIAIRKAGGAAASMRADEIVIAPGRSGKFVLLAPEQLELLEGVPAGVSSVPEDLRARAKRRFSFPYDTLADVRVAAGLRAGPSLMVTEVTGKSWRIPLEISAVPFVQNALDRIDLRLGKLRVPSRAYVWGARAVALALLFLGWLPALAGAMVPVHPTALAAGLACLVSPGVPGLLAVAITGAGLAVFHFLNAASAMAILVALGRAFVAIIAGLLAFRSRGAFQSRSLRMTPPAFLGVTMLAFWGPLVAWVLTEDEAFPLLLSMTSSVPDTWLLPAVFVGTLIVAAGPRAKR
jgi:heat shock protein HtpX